MSRDTILECCTLKELKARIHWEIWRDKFQAWPLISNSRLISSAPTLKFWLKKTQIWRERSFALRKKKNLKNWFLNWRMKKWKLMSLNSCRHKLELSSSRRSLMSLSIEETISIINWDKKLESRMRSKEHWMKKSIHWLTRAICSWDQNSIPIREISRDWDILDKLKEL